MLTEAITITTSMLGTAFFAGVAWGRLRSIDRRLETIEKMFSLKIRSDAE